MAAEEEMMMRQRTRRGNTNKAGLLAQGIVGLLVFMMGSDVHAGLIVSNLAGDDGTNFGGTGIYAQSFTTDAQLYSLSSITLKVAVFTYLDGTSASGIEVAIRDNDGSTPGTVLGSFIIPSLPSGDFGDTVFLPSTGIFLSPSTTYWITTTHSSEHPGAFQFRGTADGATGPGTMGSLLSSTDSGLSWGSASLEDMKLEVDGKVVPTPIVPTPGAILLGTIGAGLVGCLRRRRTL